MNLNPEQLWQRVSDVGGISGLLNVISHSELNGDQRSCTLADGAALTETIVAVDNVQRRVAYTITDSPFPLEYHAASMQVTDAGSGRSNFTWITDLKPDTLEEPFTQLMDGEMEQLKTAF